MSGVRLELSLKERLAALAARQEEHDRKSMALRRFYVAQLRHYAVQNKVREAGVVEPVPPVSATRIASCAPAGAASGTGGAPRPDSGSESAGVVVTVGCLRHG